MRDCQRAQLRRLTQHTAAGFKTTKTRLASTGQTGAKPIAARLPDSRSAMRLAWRARASHRPSARMAANCAARNRCLDSRWPARLRRSAIERGLGRIEEYDRLRQQARRPSSHRMTTRRCRTAMLFAPASRPVGPTHWQSARRPCERRATAHARSRKVLRSRLGSRRLVQRDSLEPKKH